MDLPTLTKVCSVAMTSAVLGMTVYYAAPTITKTLSNTARYLTTTGIDSYVDLKWFIKNHLSSTSTDDATKNTTSDKTEKVDLRIGGTLTVDNVNYTITGEDPLRYNNGEQDYLYFGDNLAKDLYDSILEDKDAIANIIVNGTSVDEDQQRRIIQLISSCMGPKLSFRPPTLGQLRTIDHIDPAITSIIVNMRDSLKEYIIH